MPNVIDCAGTSVPEIFRAGTFYQNSELIFWDVRNREKALAVDHRLERHPLVFCSVLVVVLLQDGAQHADVVRRAEGQRGEDRVWIRDGSRLLAAWVSVCRRRTSCMLPVWS